MGQEAVAPDIKDLLNKIKEVFTMDLKAVQAKVERGERLTGIEFDVLMSHELSIIIHAHTVEAIALTFQNGKDQVEKTVEQIKERSVNLATGLYFDTKQALSKYAEDGKVAVAAEALDESGL